VYCRIAVLSATVYCAVKVMADVPAVNMAARVQAATVHVVLGYDSSCANANMHC